MPPKNATRKKAADRRGPRKMTAQHKRAIQRGRAENAAVANYLEAISAPRARGRKPDPARMRSELGRIDREIRSAGAFDRLLLLQRKADLRARLNASSTVDPKPLEAQFVKVARSFSERKGITYSTWREAGVHASVLARAKISRSS